MLHPQGVCAARPERLRVHKARVASRGNRNAGLICPVWLDQIYVGCWVRHIRHRQTHPLPRRPAERQHCVLRCLSRGYRDRRAARRYRSCNG